MVPERAASMLNPSPVEGVAAANLGGSTRVKGLDVRRFRIPMRFRVGLRPAGAERGVDLDSEVSSLEAGERASRMGRRGEVMAGLREEKSLGDGGARVREKLVGFRIE